MKKPRRYVNVERKSVDSSNDNLWVDGELAFRIEREQLANGKRGIWLLFKLGDPALHNKVIDRDQYSNDLICRIECGHYDSNVQPMLNRYHHDMDPYPR